MLYKVSLFCLSLWLPAWSLLFLFYLWFFWVITTRPDIRRFRLIFIKKLLCSRHCCWRWGFYSRNFGPWLCSELLLNDILISSSPRCFTLGNEGCYISIESTLFIGFPHGVRRHSDKIIINLLLLIMYNTAYNKISCIVVKFVLYKN